MASAGCVGCMQMCVGVPYLGICGSVRDCAQVYLGLHISLESNLDKFLIPKIPKTDLQSSQIVESDGTLGISKTKNVPIFYIYL